jgi:hypothetical protein
LDRYDDCWLSEVLNCQEPSIDPFNYKSFSNSFIIAATFQTEPRVYQLKDLLAGFYAYGLLIFVAVVALVMEIAHVFIKSRK